MSRVDGRVTVHPIGSARPSAVLDVSWSQYPKSARARAAVKAVTQRMRPIYLGQTLVVEAGNIAALGDEGIGTINVNGKDVAHFAAVVIPPPVPAQSLFEG